MFTKCFFCITNDNSSLYANLKPKLLFGYQQRSVFPASQKYHGSSKISYRKLPPPTRARRTSQPIIGRHGFSSTPAIFAQNGVSPNHDTPRFTHSGFIAMSSSQTSSRWSHSKRSQRLSIVAHKLLCAEGDWHKEKVKLLREIKRLRSEVDLMVEMYNNSQLEVQGMVSRLKAQPPPPVPKRSTGHHHNENHEQTRTDHTNSISPEDEEMRRIRKHKKGKEKEGQRATNDDLGRWRSRNRSSHKANPNLTISVPAATPISPTTPSARYARGSRMRPKVDAQIRDDRHGNEKDRKFAEGIDKCADKWDSMVRSFFKRLEEIEAGNEGEMYERYVGDEGWDFGVIEWAKTENVELTDVDKMCWRVRYLEGYKLIREGRRVVLIETGVF